MIIKSAKDILRPVSFPYLAVTDEDDIYGISGELQIRDTEVLPPNAQILLLSGGHEVYTVDSDGTVKSSFYLQQPNSYQTGFSTPVLLKKYPSFKTNRTNFVVISDYYNQAQLKFGASATVGGDSDKVISSNLYYIEYSHSGDTNFTTVFKVDLGASYTIKKIGVLCNIYTSNASATASARIGYSTDDSAYTDGTAADSTATDYEQVYPGKFEDVTARYIRFQIKISDAAQTVYARLWWLPCWVAKG